jgi:riboflavin kinase
MRWEAFLKTLCLRGKVFSGKGEGAKFMKLSWVKKQIEEKLGFVPYPGTLDVRITIESVELKRALAEGGVDIFPAAGFHRGKCYRASFRTELLCALVVPEVAGYPENVIEIIGPENLREKFHLSDGDPVEVKVMF